MWPYLFLKLLFMRSMEVQLNDYEAGCLVGPGHLALVLWPMRTVGVGPVSPGEHPVEAWSVDHDPLARGYCGSQAS